MKQKNFKEIYDNIYQNCGIEIEKKRKETLKKDILAFAIAVVVWVLILASGLSRLIFVFIILFIITIIALSIAIVKINKQYKKMFKENVINEIVKQSNPSFVYSDNKGIRETEYSESKFDFGWDRYHSEDMIEGKLEDGSLLKMSQVHTEEEHETTDSDGHTSTTYVTTFMGLYGIIKLKTATNADFSIINNSKLSKFNKNRIEMESTEFEKYYDVFSGSKDSGIRQNAMEILTPDAIESLVKIRNLFEQSINIRVYKDKIYFRIGVGDIFEAPTFKSSVNFEMLQKYFLIIDVPRMVYETLIDSILVMYGDKEAREKRNLANMTDEKKQEYLKNKEELEKKSYFKTN